MIPKEKYTKQLYFDKTPLKLHKRFGDINDLIGEQFKRNKYGLSDWTYIVDFVGLRYSSKKVNGEIYIVPTIYVKSNSGPHSYDLDEIVLIFSNDLQIKSFKLKKEQK